MCGIAGIWYAHEAKAPAGATERAAHAIARRGPDAQAVKTFPKAALVHTRLSIIDTSARSNQPMSDPKGRFWLIFNGEIYNYRELATYLRQRYSFKNHTQGDTEVLLHGLIHEGKAFLHRTNGFFSFAMYDLEKHEVLAARDRYGIKPLYYSCQDGTLALGSTLGTVMALVPHSEIDHQSLHTYLQLSYIPAPATMLKHVHKLLPGHALHYANGRCSVAPWYRMPEGTSGHQQASPSTQFAAMLAESVRTRLVADVPLGTFLSGGLDSSVITLLTHREQPGIPAFSIGFPDQPYLDESAYAAQIAKHIGIPHHIIPLYTKDLESNLYEVLDAFDEPFADSSAVLVNLLSLHTRGHVKVALSGDGADELLGGYNKHRALLRSVRGSWINTALRAGEPALRMLPESRHHGMFDRLRRLKRYSRGLRLDFSQRYCEWASFTPQPLVQSLLLSPNEDGLHPQLRTLLLGLNPTDFNTVLRTDLQWVLPNDMLYKVDSMSMHRGLEVRVPFLDHRLVEWVLSLPAVLKLNARGGKLLLREAFSGAFPTGMFDRPKRGFEAPLGHWMATLLAPHLDKYTAPEYVQRQGLFDARALIQLRKKAAGKNPGDTPHTLWAVLVFQHWYSRYMENHPPPTA